LAPFSGGTDPLVNGQPELSAPRPTYEMAERTRAISCGGVPVTPRWRKRHLAGRTRILRMNFKTFVQSLMLIPAQIIRHGRQLIVRILSWRPDLPVLFRLMDAL
jgi:hypothetical protein